MNKHPMCGWPLAKLSKRRDGAFTLIELLTVMAVIVVLAGLVVGAASMIQNKAARARAQAEIAGLGAAIKNFETDNGTVPRNGDTDNLDARRAFDPGTAGSGAYSLASAFLYKMLSGNFYLDQNNILQTWRSGIGDHPDRPKTYFDFKVTQVSGATVTNGRISNPGSVNALIDPFGLSYGYSTAYQKDSEGSTNATPARGFNPSYDLWSTAGFGAGKSYPTNITTDTDKPSVWIKNWN